MRGMAKGTHARPKNRSRPPGWEGGCWAKAGPAVARAYRPGGHLPSIARRVGGSAAGREVAATDQQQEGAGGVRCTASKRAAVSAWAKKAPTVWVLGKARFRSSHESPEGTEQQV